MVDRSANFTQKDGVSLRDYFDSRLSAIEKATAVAYDSMNKRLEGMNEFRASIQDITGKTVTRTEFDQLRERLTDYASCSDISVISERIEQMRIVREQQIKGLSDEIQSLSEFRAELRGKASTTSVTVSYIIAGISILFSIISLIEKINP